jgi:hypothetical protein
MATMSPPRYFPDLAPRPYPYTIVYMWRSLGPKAIGLFETVQAARDHIATRQPGTHWPEIQICDRVSGEAMVTIGATR